MTIIEITSLVLSATVVIVAGITAIVSYLNYKAITTFTLYLRAETKDKTSPLLLERSGVSTLFSDLI